MVYFETATPTHKYPNLLSINWQYKLRVAAELPRGCRRQHFIAAGKPDAIVNDVNYFIGSAF
jgi:hypothetical protein